MSLKKIMQTIFSIRNIDKYKQIMILGFKFKFKNKKINNVVAIPSKYIYPIVSYEINRKKGIDIRNNYSYTIDMTGQISYHILNKIKEISLKRKVRDGKKIHVAFFLDTLSKFSTNSVYHAMKKSKLFEPYIILGYTYESDLSNDIVWKKHINEYNKIKGAGYKVYSLFNNDRSCIPLEKFKIDIIFLCVPYLEMFSSMKYSNIFLNINYLVCYVNYGFIVGNTYNYYYNNRRINTTWKNFALSKFDYDEYLAYSIDCGLNTILSGYPKLDAYTKPLIECKIPEKLNNGKPIVIYAPHWSVVHTMEAVDLGTFDIYYKYFLELVKNNKDINFVFKPHPALAHDLVKNNIMTYEEFDQYTKE